MSNVSRDEIAGRSSPSAQPPTAGPDHSTGPIIETLQEQAERLGLLEPLDAEPAHVFSVDGLDE